MSQPLYTSFTTSPEEKGVRFDFLLAQKLGASRSQAQKLIRNGSALVNDAAVKVGYEMRVGDEVVFVDTVEPVAVDTTTKEEMIRDIPVIAETDEYLVVNKPAGVLVHPTEAGEKHTLAAWLVQHYPELQQIGENPDRPGIVHRLDKEASGLLVVARTQAMFHHLKQQFQQRTTEKFYDVLVYGEVERDYGMITFPIDRGPDGRMVSRPNIEEITLETVSSIQPGREAITEFWVERRFVNHTLLRVKIHTGRTHQIRVHFFAYNQPVVGDTLYKQRRFREARGQEPLNRLFLHATELSFTTLDGTRVSYTAPLPDILEQYLTTLRSR